MEKIVKPISGLIGFLIILIVLAASVFFFLQIKENDVKPWTIVAAVLLLITGLFLMKGLMIIQPNHSRVLNLFGKYVGSVKDNGWFFVNPFYTTENIS
ncbi:MAG: SPFH domain-containing protein, partial [Flavisolibacter sp.]|nr:SPFH domain-containing protein [Flavisolibacter sp.]